MEILGDRALESTGVDQSYEWASQYIDDPVRRLICERDGHRVVDDMCMMPAHRFCLVCEELMPDMPVKEEGW
jgi:hypothetical protein